MSDTYTPDNFDRNIWGLIIHEPLTKARADWFVSKIMARMERGVKEVSSRDLAICECGFCKHLRGSDGEKNSDDKP